MKQINCQVHTCDYNNFQMLYPGNLSAFVRNCVRLAVLDKDFFTKICFYNFENKECSK